MKDSHIYNRMNELDNIIYYLDFIDTKPLIEVKYLVGNIALEASDHEFFDKIIYAYQKRLINEQL